MVKEEEALEGGGKKEAVSMRMDGVLVCVIYAVHELLADGLIHFLSFVDQLCSIMSLMMFRAPCTLGCYSASLSCLVSPVSSCGNQRVPAEHARDPEHSGRNQGRG